MCFSLHFHWNHFHLTPKHTNSSKESANIWTPAHTPPLPSPTRLKRTHEERRPGLTKLQFEARKSSMDVSVLIPQMSREVVSPRGCHPANGTLECLGGLAVLTYVNVGMLF